MRIGINLATRPFTDLGPILKRLRIGMGVLAAIAIAFLFGLHELHQKAEQARAREQEVEARIQRLSLEHQNAQAMMLRPENASVLESAQNLNQLFDTKGFSWTLAMEDLETALPAGVQVVTLEPARDKDGNITVKLRVVGPRDKEISFVQNLEHARHFLAPRIVGESAENAEGPGQRALPVSTGNRVNFEIQASYNPPSTEELTSAKRSKAAAAAGDADGTNPGTPATPHARTPYDGIPHPARPHRAGSPTSGVQR